jgi:hypothetical protein
MIRVVTLRQSSCLDYHMNGTTLDVGLPFLNAYSGELPAHRRYFVPCLRHSPFLFSA